MAYFEWVDDLVIDHGPIDQDHRHLVDLVNQPHTATSQGRGREVGFPRLEQHQIGHAHFIGQLEELKRQYEAGSITVASQLSSVLGCRCTSAAPTRRRGRLCKRSQGAEGAESERQAPALASPCAAICHALTGF